MDDEQRAQLQAAIDRLAAGLDTVSFQLPGPRRAAREELTAELHWHLTEYLRPRLDDLDAPAVVVLIGSTGAGKSTLLNTIAGRSVSRAGAVRPTTSRPVVWSHRSEADRYGRDLLPSFAGVDRTLDVVAHDDDAFSGVTVVDTPDLDSVEVSHREIAEEVLAAADLCVFVTSAQRYADAVPWQVLRDIRARELPLVIVLNRLPAGGAAAVVDDLRRRLAAARVPDTDDIEILPIVEQPSLDPGGVLDRSAIAPLTDRLHLLADRAHHRALVLEAVTAGLRHVQRLGDALAEEIEHETAEVQALRQAAVKSYDTERDELDRSLREGRLIRAEVLARWEAFIGTGELIRVLSEGAGRVRAWFRRVLGGRERALEVEDEARTTIADVVTNRADRAAATTAGAWELSPAGRELLDPTLWRAAPETADRARRALEDWLAELAGLVEREGEGKRRVAQVASAGVNVVAVALMLAVFAQTGGLTGAEVGITAGAAALQQRLLEHLFGTAQARALIEEGRVRLDAAMSQVLSEDRRRFEDRLVPVTPPAGAAAEIRTHLRPFGDHAAGTEHRD